MISARFTHDGGHFSHRYGDELLDALGLKPAGIQRKLLEKRLAAFAE
jgi:hypothetical protein